MTVRMHHRKRNQHRQSWPMRMLNPRFHPKFNRMLSRFWLKRPFPICSQVHHHRRNVNPCQLRPDCPLETKADQCSRPPGRQFNQPMLNRLQGKPQGKWTHLQSNTVIRCQQSPFRKSTLHRRQTRRQPRRPHETRPDESFHAVPRPKWSTPRRHAKGTKN